MTAPAPVRTSESLNKEKRLLLASKTQTFHAWITLAEAYSEIDEDHQVEFCMTMAKKYQSRIDPDECDN